MRAGGLSLFLARDVIFHPLFALLGCALGFAGGLPFLHFRAAEYSRYFLAALICGESGDLFPDGPHGIDIGLCSRALSGRELADGGLHAGVDPLRIEIAPLAAAHASLPLTAAVSTASEQEKNFACFAFA